MKLDFGLLVSTIIIAISLSLGMWIVGAIPFNVKTLTLHIISIYIGVASVLLYQKNRLSNE